MRKSSSSTCTISDIISWNEQNEIELSPKYQRNSVWNENAKSYLIDTIIRGLPIPPIFIRKTIDVNTKTTNREVLDGQQRIRTILEYINGDFFIKKTHNDIYGNMLYNDLNDDEKANILGYEILCEYITEKEDSVVYDMFARLNSNNYVLNKQEIRNSKYWGEFKVLAYNLSSKYREFFINNEIMSDKDCIRMKDVELINSMIILYMEGIVGESQNYIDDIYKKYDKEILNIDEIKNKINFCMDWLEIIYKENKVNMSIFTNKNYFFSLFLVLSNQLFGIINDNNITRNSKFSNENIIFNKKLLIDRINCFISDYERIFIDKDLNDEKYNNLSQFDKDNRMRTTNKDGRVRRIIFLNKYFE